MTITVDIVWPETLPLPFLDYSGTPQNASISSDAESPRAYRRSRFFTAYEGIDVEWRLDSTQLAAFETFFYDTLGNGAASFQTDLLYPQNDAVESWIVRFVGGYSCDLSDGPSVVRSKFQLLRSTEISEPVT